MIMLYDPLLRLRRGNDMDSFFLADDCGQSNCICHKIEQVIMIVTA